MFRVLLCQIVGILEKSPLIGVNGNPKSMASSKHNIRKALDMLKKKGVI